MRYWHVVPVVLSSTPSEPQNSAGAVDQSLILQRFFLEILMLSIFRRLMKNERGATAIEYVLIASLISVAAIAAMQTVGQKVSNVLSNVASSMN
jgi:pilus assembly protein Flp/PilA